MLLHGIPVRIVGLLTSLYCGTWSFVKSLSHHFVNICVDLVVDRVKVLDRVASRSYCGASVGNTRVTDLTFIDDTLMLADLLELLVMTFEVLHGKGRLL